MASALAPRDARFTGMRGAGWVGWVALPHQPPRAHAIALQDTDGRISPLTRASAPLSGEDHQEDYPQADLQRVQGRPPEADQAREALRDLRQEAQDQGPDVLSIILIVQSLVNLLQSNEFSAIPSHARVPGATAVQHLANTPSNPPRPQSRRIYNRELSLRMVTRVPPPCRVC